MDLCIGCAMLYAIYGGLLLSKIIEFNHAAQFILVVGALIIFVLYLRAEAKDSVERAEYGQVKDSIERAECCQTNKKEEKSP